MLTSELLLPLTCRVASLAVPSRTHEELWTIGEETAAWARARGLVIGDADTSRLGRGRFERLACRLFPEAPAARVALFAKWLIWLFAFDDLRDESPFGGSATSVDALYADLLRTVRRGEARGGAGPLETTLAELWRETVPGMSGEWRRRFRIHLEWHRQGCLDEAVCRRTQAAPSLEDYPRLRRRTAGPFAYDLAEPVLGVEVPEPLVRSRSWQRLVDAVGDVMGWCNDVASYPHEAGRGDTCNHVAVTALELGLDPVEAVDRVNGLIAARAALAEEALDALAAEPAWQALEPSVRRRVGGVADALLAAPRAQMDWMLESGRYSPMPDPSVPSPRRRVGVTLA